jgi:hypothetical protein
MKQKERRVTSTQEREGEVVAIKKAKKRESSAPIIEVALATCRLSVVEFRSEPTEIITKDGSRSFIVDPGLNALVEIVDDHADGENDDVTFYQNFRLKWDTDEEEWELRDGTALGALARAKYGNNFFEEETEFNPEDFEGFQFMCKIVPKKNPSTGQLCGSMCHHETIMAVPTKKRKPSKAAKQAEERNNEEFDQLPFDGMSAEDEALMNKALGKAELEEEPV